MKLFHISRNSAVQIIIMYSKTAGDSLQLILYFIHVMNHVVAESRLTKLISTFDTILTTMAFQFSFYRQLPYTYFP